MFKGLFVLEFNKCNSLLLINVQDTLVNPIKVFELKNYFTTLFQFTMSYSIFVTNYFFWFKHPLHTIALQKITISSNFLLIFIYFRRDGSSK